MLWIIGVFKIISAQTEANYSRLNQKPKVSLDKFMSLVRQTDLTSQTLNRGIKTDNHQNMLRSCWAWYKSISMRKVNLIFSLSFIWYQKEHCRLGDGMGHCHGRSGNRPIGFLTLVVLLLKKWRYNCSFSYLNYANTKLSSCRNATQPGAACKEKISLRSSPQHFSHVKKGLHLTTNAQYQEIYPGHKDCFL